MKKSLILVFLFVLFLGTSKSNSSTSVESVTDECISEIQLALDALEEMNGTVCGELVYNYPKALDLHLKRLDEGWSKPLGVYDAMDTIGEIIACQYDFYANCPDIIEKLDALVDAINNYCV